MARTCTVCSHAQREVIDHALVSGRSTYDLAALYRVSPDALSRHNAAHLPAALKKAGEVKDVAHAIDIVAQLKAINGASLHILNEARRAGNGELVLKAVDRVHRQVELQAKLLGELDERPQVNVLLAPEWLTLRGALMGALAAYPEARTSVAAQLMAIERPQTNGYH